MHKQHVCASAFLAVLVLVFVCMRPLPFSGELLQEFEVVALLAGCLGFVMHLVTVSAVQIAEMRVVWVDAISFIGLGDDFIHVGVAFEAHFVAEVALERRVIEVIGDIPDGFLHFILDAVLMAVDAPQL